MGSEFAFEDLSSFEIDKYKFKYLGEEKINDIDTFKELQYDNIVRWFDELSQRDAVKTGINI